MKMSPVSWSKSYIYRIGILASLCRFACGDVKTEDIDAKLKVWYACAECVDLTGWIGDKLLMKLKTGESCIKKWIVRQGAPKNHWLQ